LTKDVAMELRADFARREVGRPGGDKEPMRMTTVTSHGLWTFALEVTTTAHGRTVRAYGRLLVGAGADHPVWAGLVAGDALDVTLDLSEVTAIDAGGLGRLLRVRRRLAARGGGEEFLVLAGSFHDDAGDYPDGTYVRNPIGTAHAPWAGPDGAVLFLKLHQFTAADSRRVVIDTRAAHWRQGLVKA
jgi:hypothetical protein